MADTTKKADNATKRNTEPAKLPRAKGKNAVQEEFFSVNGRNYILQRGVTIEVPSEVAEVIRNGEKAEEYALSYSEDLVKAEADKMRDFGIN